MQIANQTDAISGANVIMGFTSHCEYGLTKTQYVVYEGSIYKAIVNTIPVGALPSNTNYWELVQFGGISNADPDSIIYTDNNGDLQTLSISTGVLTKDNTNGLHFAPPTLRVKQLGRDLKGAYPIVTLIGTNDRIYGWGIDSEGYILGKVGTVYEPAQLPEPDAKTGTWAMVQTSALTIIAVTSTGQLWGKGYNTSKAIGPDDIYVEWQLLATDIKEAQIDGYTQYRVRILAITNDGRVLSSGNNSYARLGRTGDIDKLLPITFADLPSSNKIIKLARRENKHYTAMIALSDESGDNAYGWGRNAYGELGLGASDQKDEPVKLVGVGHFTDVIMLCTYSSYATCSAIIDGQAKSSGRNYYHCGNGNSTSQKVFTGPTSGFSGYVKVAGNDSYAGNVFYITSSKNLHRWGHNGGVGALGIGTTAGSSTPATEITHPNADIDGKVIDVVSAGRCIYAPSLVLLENGDAYASGYGGNYQQGIIPKANQSSFHKLSVKNIVAIDIIANDSTASSMVMVDDNGVIYTNGINILSGQGYNNHVSTPTPITLFSQ